MNIAFAVLKDYHHWTTTGWRGAVNAMVWLGLGKSLIHAAAREPFGSVRTALGGLGIAASLAGTMIAVLVFREWRAKQRNKKTTDNRREAQK